MSILSSIKSIGEHTKTISLVFGVCGTIFGAVSWYANVQVNKYKDSQEKIINQEEIRGFGVKIDRLVRSDSLMTISIGSLSTEIHGNTRETKANSKAIATHLENEKAWKELVDFWRDQAQERASYPPDVPMQAPPKKELDSLTITSRQATKKQADSLNNIYERKKIR